MDSGEVGRVGEEIACTFLQRKGFVIIERNYRKQWGEIDIIAKKGRSVRFVEVKTVSRETHQSRGELIREEYRPEEMVHPAKMKKLARTAELYMADRGEDEFQIDVVGVFLDPKRRTARCRLLECVS